mgnify:CR=1 FL=1
MDIITNRRVTIVGGGNAGLLCALILRRAFSEYQITVVKSDKIGTIGVGEGSTEHWRTFMNFAEIEAAELLVGTLATHKKGIRFEGWTNHTPDYFHAISGLPEGAPFVGEFDGAYAGMVAKGLLFSNTTGFQGIASNHVAAINPHQTVNQFHFDTAELNDFLIFKCQSRGIKFHEGEVVDVVLSDVDWIESVRLDGEEELIGSDFWIDASGFNQVLMSRLPGKKWNSFSEYLLTDSAIAFRTPADESGEIRPYTRARALDNGWAWEIPTQKERGNGYVYSSQFCSEEQAVAEMETLLDVQISDYRHFHFDPGYLEEPWVGNCVAVGLSGSFVEPLEATSIGSTVNQSQALLGFLAPFRKGNEYSVKQYNSKFKIMMLNILDMIRLHYISDREDTDFWKAQKEMPIPESLKNLLGVWSERPPEITDIQGAWLMFRVPHFYHVAQGQGKVNREAASESITALGLADKIEKYIWKLREHKTSGPVIDHAKALKEICED